jgi:hypothetical protein
MEDPCQKNKVNLSNSIADTWDIICIHSHNHLGVVTGIQTEEEILKKPVDGFASVQDTNDLTQIQKL